MQIAPDIHALKIPFTIPIAPDKSIDRFVYSYVLLHDKICLIDSGVAGSEGMILDYIEQRGKGCQDVELLLLTHSHPDHIGSAKAVQEKCQCVVAAHANAREWVEDVEKQFQDRPVPGFHSLVGGSVRIDQLLGDGDTVEVGNTDLQVIHTPGHSNCSISLFSAESGVLFSGDAIPQGSDLPIYDDVAKAVQSIRKLKKIAGIKNLLSSWSDPVPDMDPYTLMDEGLLYFQRIHSCIRQLEDREALNDPMNLCAQVVEKLGLPEVAINPLVAKSLYSHVPIIDQEQL